MDFYRFVFICFTFAAFTMDFGNSYKVCNDSAATSEIVKSCPQNAKEWKEASGRKDCEKMNHSCSSFEYHCAINAWGTETIEVCAPRMKIVGNACTEYSSGGERIQRSQNVQCEKCPDYYFSNESFKYQECYENVKYGKKPHIDNQKTFNYFTPIIICVVVAIAAVFIFFTIKQRSWANRLCFHLQKPVLINVEEGLVQNQLLESAHKQVELH